MRRLRLDIGYDGTYFSGWAAQPDRRTVQGVLEDALGRVLGSPGRTTCAGRTDAGVHARGQVCHVDAPAGPAPEEIRRRLAGVLPLDVRVHDVTDVDSGFDARFSALWRRYSYFVCDDAALLDPLRRHEVLQHAHALDVNQMAQACAALIGEHDFAAFCRKRERTTTIRTLREFTWSRLEPGLVEARVVADAFCHNMVRSLVGAALLVGDGRRTLDWPARVLAAGQRPSDLTVVKPHGLTLQEVGYPSASHWASRAAEAQTARVAR